jgi:hypothetical protein
MVRDYHFPLGGNKKGGKKYYDRKFDDLKIPSRL